MSVAPVVVGLRWGGLPVGMWMLGFCSCWLTDVWLDANNLVKNKLFFGDFYLVNNIGFGWLPPWLIVPRLFTGSLCFFLWWIKEELSGPVQLHRSHL